MYGMDGHVDLNPPQVYISSKDRIPDLRMILHFSEHRTLILMPQCIPNVETCICITHVVLFFSLPFLLYMYIVYLLDKLITRSLHCFIQ